MRIGDIIVSKVAIVILNATSPPAMKENKLADVPLGTVPDKITPIATSLIRDLVILKNILKLSELFATQGH